MQRSLCIAKWVMKQVEKEKEGITWPNKKKTFCTTVKVSFVFALFLQWIEQNQWMKRMCEWYQFIHWWKILDQFFNVVIIEFVTVLRIYTIP